jgi:hypothetical protein
VPEFRYSGEVQIAIWHRDGVYRCEVQQGDNGSIIHLPVELDESQDPLDPRILDDIAIAAIFYAHRVEPALYANVCYTSDQDVYISRDKRSAWLS